MDVAEGSVDPWPTRFGCKVDLWMKRHANSNQQVFLADNISKLFHQFSIADCRKAQRLTHWEKSMSLMEKILLLK